MKRICLPLKIFFPALFILTSVYSLAQQQLIITSSRANNYCNYACTLIDIPELNGNPSAIVFVTSIEVNGINLDPHPICAYYISNKWSVFNIDGASIPAGAQFSVEYYIKPDSIHFVHIVTPDNLVVNNNKLRKKGSYIDHEGLNNDPGARFRYFQNWAPSQRGGIVNRYETKIQYDSTARQWYISNTNDRAMENFTAYNIIIIPSGAVTKNQLIPKNQIKGDKPLDSAKVMVLTPPPPVTPIEVLPAILQGTRADTAPKLFGFVDMHTHPVAQLAFGGQLFYGENDGDPRYALGSCNCVHNFIADPTEYCNPMNLYRNQMVDKIDHENNIIPAHLKKEEGFPAFRNWPKYNSLLHQQMWIDWIKRAKEGGLRIMVALAVNNQTIADAAEVGGAIDDLSSMNKQLIRMKELFGGHADFLEIAYTSADLRRIVNSGKLAVILGIEMDNIGNFCNPIDKKNVFFNPNPTDVDIRYEIDRLFTLGVRYIFPIHITNNVFGGTAFYENKFNIANKYNTGNTFLPEVVSSDEGIEFKLQSPFTSLRQDFLGGVFMGITGPVLPPSIMPDVPSNYPMYVPLPPMGQGNRNSIGLTIKGEMAIRYMMQKGMIIDIDHMSEKSATEVLDMAASFNYPVNSGHNDFRGPGPKSQGIGANNENARTDEQVRKIYRLGGILGLGHGGSASNFVSHYRYGLTLTGAEPIAIGTDVNGFFPLPGPPVNGVGNITYSGTLTKCVLGNKEWDFNTEGMAHYGLFPDFIESCKNVGMSAAEKNTFFLSAERFARMWEKCNTSKTNVHKLP